MKSNDIFSGEQFLCNGISEEPDDSDESEETCKSTREHNFWIKLVFLMYIPIGCFVFGLLQLPCLWKKRFETWHVSDKCRTLVDKIVSSVSMKKLYFDLHNNQDYGRADVLIFLKYLYVKENNKDTIEYLIDDIIAEEDRIHDDHDDAMKCMTGGNEEVSLWIKKIMERNSIFNRTKKNFMKTLKQACNSSRNKKGVLKEILVALQARVITISTLVSVVLIE